MKILHVNCNYLTTVMHQTMMEHLDATGVENVVFAPTDSLKKAVITPRENVYARECFQPKDRMAFYRKQRKIRRALQKEIDVAEFDCIHAYTVFTDGYCAMKLSKKYHVPYVVAVRSTDINVFFQYMFHLKRTGVEILRNAAAVFFLSDAYREQLFREYLPAHLKDEIQAKTYIIGNGIDDFWFEHAVCPDLKSHLDRINAGQLKIVYAGRVNVNKNPLRTLRALRLLKEKGITLSFTVVGKVEARKVLETLQADPMVTYLPQQPKEKLAELYKDQDIFVMPSHQETFGLVYAEAMSQGLPVLYTRGQGFDGQVPDGQGGYAIDPNSQDDIAEKMLKICENYEKFAMDAFHSVDRFRWDQICERYQLIYQKVCGKNEG